MKSWAEPPYHARHAALARIGHGHLVGDTLTVGGGRTRLRIVVQGARERCAGWRDPVAGPPVLSALQRVLCPVPRWRSIDVAYRPVVRWHYCSGNWDRRLCRYQAASGYYSNGARTPCTQSSTHYLSPLRKGRHNRGRHLPTLRESDIGSERVSDPGATSRGRLWCVRPTALDGVVRMRGYRDPARRRG